MSRLSEQDKEDLKQAVYEIVAAIPKGMVSSYGEVARLSGYPGYQRMVGRILRDVPDELGLPCHRVLNSQGRLVPGWNQQVSLLYDEGIMLKPNGYVDMKRFSWNPMKAFDM